MTGSLEGTSSETMYESREKDKYGNLTPFQMELLSAGMQNESLEGRGSEESGTWKADEMCDAWDESENQEGAGLEAQLLTLSTQGEPRGVDLVGGINMKEMADAVVWSEIMGRPIAYEAIKDLRCKEAFLVWPYPRMIKSPAGISSAGHAIRNQCLRAIRRTGK